jgi:class 3 adenylate cyclase
MFDPIGGEGGIVEGWKIRIGIGGRAILIDENTRNGLPGGVGVESHAPAHLKTRSQTVRVYSVPAGRRP